MSVPNRLMDSQPTSLKSRGAKKRLGQLTQIAFHDTGEHMRVVHVRRGAGRTSGRGATAAGGSRLVVDADALLLQVQVGVAHAFVELFAQTLNAQFAAGQTEEALQIGKNVRRILKSTTFTTCRICTE